MARRTRIEIDHELRQWQVAGALPLELTAAPSIAEFDMFHPLMVSRVLVVLAEIQSCAKSARPICAC